MILYLDASALVKRYVREPGSDLVESAIGQAALIGTSLISRAEVVAAFGKARRMSLLTEEAAVQAVAAFRGQWLDLVRVQITELVMARADMFAWEFGLRGYDAVPLAAASLWSEGVGEAVTLATFDRSLWAAAVRAGLVAYPASLPQLLEQWKPTRSRS